MLAFLSSSIATIVSLLALVVLFPAVAGFPVRLVFRALGCHIRRKARGHRELIRARVQIEEEDYRSRKSRQSKAEDDDWEKIEGDGSGEPPRVSEKESGWDGFVGFFHPFW